MEKKSSNLIVVAAIVVVVVAVGGYILGVKSSRGPGTTETVEQGTAGTALNQSMNHSVLLADLKARLKETPNDVDILTRLGDAYFELKQFDEAVFYYKQVADADPASADIYNDIGLALHYLGNSAEGIKYIEKGIDKNPYHQRIWLTKGFILAYGMGDLVGAKEAWEKSKALNPKSRIGQAADDYLSQASKQ